jgi:hypothetical protein
MSGIGDALRPFLSHKGESDGSRFMRANAKRLPPKTPEQLKEQEESQKAMRQKASLIGVRG